MELQGKASNHKQEEEEEDST